MSNKITIDMFNIDDANEDTSTIEYKDIVVKVKPLLSYPEMLTFVDFVVNACFDDDDGKYQPEMKDFALRYAMIEMYTNIDAPDSYSEAYPFLYENDDLIISIRDIISSYQFTAILNSIDDKIDAAVDSRANELIANMNDLYHLVFTLVDSIGKQFEGIEDGDIKNMVDALSRSDLDENKFIESYMDLVNNKKQTTGE